LNINSKF